MTRQHPLERRPRLPLSRATLLMGLAMLALPAAGGASPVTGVAGYDHFQGPFGQTTDGVLGAAVLSVGGGDAMLAGVRYDDSNIGRGYSLTVGAGLPVAPACLLRVNATRFIGDQSFHAWRAKLGPQLVLPGGRTLTLSYSRYQDDTGVRSNGAIAESTTPLIAHLEGKASASFATVPQGPAAVQASVGLGWSVIRNLELSGEVGLARNGSGASGQPFPSRGPLGGLGGGLLGGGGSGSGGNSANTNEVESTVLLGLRVTLP